MLRPRGRLCGLTPPLPRCGRRHSDAFEQARVPFGRMRLHRRHTSLRRSSAGVASLLCARLACSPSRCGTPTAPFSSSWRTSLEAEYVLYSGQRSRTRLHGIRPYSAVLVSLPSPYTMLSSAQYRLPRLPALRLVYSPCRRTRRTPTGCARHLAGESTSAAPCRPSCCRRMRSRALSRARSTSAEGSEIARPG